MVSTPTVEGALRENDLDDFMKFSPANAPGNRYEDSFLPGRRAAAAMILLIPG